MSDDDRFPHRARSVAVEVGFEPTEGFPLTRFRGLRSAIHLRPRSYLTWAEGGPRSPVNGAGRGWMRHKPSQAPGMRTVTGRLCQGESGGSPDATRPAACDDRLVRPTVVIVDDHPGFRSSARALLEAEGFDVVGEADDGASALVAAVLLHPRIVLLDVQLPDIDGFEVAERLARAGDPPAVVLVSTRDASSYRRRLARSPVRGFISKSELSGYALSALVS